MKISIYICIDNPGRIPGTYPKSIIYKPDQTSMLIFSDNIYKFPLSSAVTTSLVTITTQNFEVGGLSNLNMIAFTETRTINTFQISIFVSTKSTIGTYDFTQYSPICMFTFPSGSTINYGYAVWVHNNEIQMVSFDTTSQIKRKSYPARKIGNYIDCKGFSSEQFICVYTGKETVDNDGCFIHVFQSDLEQIYSERELYSVGCFSSTAQKIFLLNEAQYKFFICYIKANSLYCIKAYHSQGYYETLIRGTLILNSCRSEIYNFEIGQLNTYFIAVCANGENLYITQFDEDLTVKGAMPTINILGGSIVMPSLVYFNSKNTVLTYSNNAASESFYYIFIFPECTSFSVTTTINSKVLIDFTTYIDNNGYDGAKVQINSLPSTGYLFDTVGNIKAITSGQYELNKLEYYPTNADGTFECTFLGTNSFFSSSNCKVSINVLPCYFSCYTCTQAISTPQDHQCLTCDNSKGYYEVENYNPNPPALFCGNRAMAPSNFYFDTVLSKYRKCNVECGSCLDDKPSICTSCSGGYHWSDINRNSCVNTQPAHTYLDTSTDTFLPCYPSCDTCSEKGTKVKHNCNSCLSGNNFYEIEGYPTNCVDENTKPKNFFLDTNIYKECDESCETCTAVTTCTQCAEDYYPYADNRNKCVNDETKDEAYYFDYDDLLYKKCDATCKTCSGPPIGSTKNCLSCTTNYLYLGNCISQCPEPTFGYENFCIYPCPDFTAEVTSNPRICKICSGAEYLYQGNCVNPKPDGTYVVNTNFNILAKCYPNCFNCYGGGTYTNMQCTSCATRYKPLSDKPYQCYDSEPDYYYTDATNNKYMPCYESCLKCNGDGSDYNHNCRTCKVGYVSDPYKPENCYEECEYYWYKEITYPYEYKCTTEKKCPSSYPYLEPISKECAISCSQCQGCNTKNLLDLDNSCVDTCPENSIRDVSRNKCHTANDPESLLNYGIHNYIVDATDQPNKYLLGDEMYFHLCNSTDIGIEDCKNISTHMGLSYVNLSDCFEVLLSIYHYDLDAGDYFFFGAIEKLRNDTTSTQFYFVIYDKNGIKLDTDYCLNSEINVTKSYLNKQETLDAITIYNKWGYNILQYNEENPFFSDICTQFHTDDNYDVLLNDRYEYYYKNKTYYFCEENCELTDVFPNTSEIMCTCMNKENTLDNINFRKAETQISKTKDKPLQFFMCANLVFSVDTFKKNIPNYFIIIFLVLQIIFCIYFYKVGRKPLYSFIHNKLLSDGTNEAPQPNNTHQTSNPPRRASVVLDKVKAEQAQKDEEEKQIGEQYAKVFIMNQNFTDGEDYEFGDEKKNVTNGGNGNGDLSSSIDHDNVPKRRAGVALPGVKIYGAATSANNNEDDEVSRLARQLKLEQQEKKFAEEVLSKYPDTSFTFLYSFCIKRKHKILSLFYNKDIYDIFSFKLSFLILSFTIDFFITTLFFFNFHLRSLFHHLKHSRLLYEIGFGIISALVSYLIVKFLSWVMEYKSSFKRYEVQNGAEEDKKEYFNRMNNLMFNLNVKFVFYYIFMFMGTIFIWYFVTSFCSTYPKSQLSWGIGIATNIIISLIFPFIYYAIVVFMQHTGLVKMKMNLYKVAMFFIRF